MQRALIGLILLGTLALVAGIGLNQIVDTPALGHLFRAFGG